MVVRSKYRVLVGKSEEKNYLGGPGVDVSVTLSCIFRKWDVGVWTMTSWLRIGIGRGHLGIWLELSGSVK
jgi:hypothetical protein